MSQPFHTTFSNARLYERLSNKALWLSTGLSVLAFLTPQLALDQNNLADFFNKSSCFFIVIYVAFSWLVEYMFSEASQGKRLDFIDNSFGTNYAEHNTANYYSNDDLQAGIYKMAVNNFENSFFTYSIARLMLPKLWFRNGAVAILFFVLVLVGDTSTLIMLLQLTLPLLLIRQGIKHTFLVFWIKRVCWGYRALFQEIKGKDKIPVPLLIYNVLEYETALSWGCILLDEKIFASQNLSLSEQWEKIKETYAIRSA